MTWEETLRREVHEEACPTVVRARLLGFSRGVCMAEHEKGLVLVRSFWRAEVELAPWEPPVEIPHRRVFSEAEVWDLLMASHKDRSASILVRAIHESAMKRS